MHWRCTISFPVAIVALCHRIALGGYNIRRTHALTALCLLQFGFNNGQTMVDGLYAGNTSQVKDNIPAKC